MRTEYIARISYGKDSLKMLDVIWTRGLPLDRITTTDVWATDTISANLPPMDEFKKRMDEKIYQLYGIRVEHLCARNKDGTKRTYEQMFYHVPNRRSRIVHVERESRFGSDDPRGFPVVGVPWCQPLLKKQPAWERGSIKGFPLATGVTYCQKLKTERVSGTDFSVVQENSENHGAAGEKINTVEYLGIAADEPNRFGQLNEKKRAPLVEFGIDEELCGLYCRYADMLSPTYETSFRDGCWFCHNQGVNQLRLLRKNWPDHWALLLKWDLDSPVSFKADGHTVHDFDRRFELEDLGLLPTDKTFRWSMMDDDLQRRWF
jgi:hypothetical protein